MHNKQIILPAVCGILIGLFAIFVAVCLVAQPTADADADVQEFHPAPQAQQVNSERVIKEPAFTQSHSSAGRPVEVEHPSPEPILAAAPIRESKASTAVIQEPVTESSKDSHHELERLLKAHGITALPDLPKQIRAKVELGRNLFFDKILSGNKDIACATCHHPAFQSGDDISLPIGTRGVFLGAQRQLGYGRDFIPRNSPEVFNRGFDEWRTMFWDSRVSKNQWGKLITPAGTKLPRDLDNVLAAQAMFPPTSREEMRGRLGEIDTRGAPNEVALLNDSDFQGIWRMLMRQIREIPAYVRLFEEAYPSRSIRQLGFEHAANAIAAFEIEAFTLVESPWDRYLKGERNAMSDDAMDGAILFYGKANCASCHAGNLFTDQEHHNIGVPQVGPGKKNGLDLGRAEQTGMKEDLFTFRTPPLRNTTVTGPWMHNGAFTKLKDAVRHHLDPVRSTLNYTPRNLRPDLRKRLVDAPEVQVAILKNLAPKLRSIGNLKDTEIENLLAFLRSMTDPAVKNLADVAPYTVPSGLKVDRPDS
jgi:cytochrome c peroxidase